MNRTTMIFGAALALTMLGPSGAWAAADCGTKPVAPELPADGATVVSKEMDVIADNFDAYQAKFAEFNKCSINEFNEVQKKFEDLIAAYAAKGKKK